MPPLKILVLSGPIDKNGNPLDNLVLEQALRNTETRDPPAGQMGSRTWYNVNPGVPIPEPQKELDTPKFGYVLRSQQGDNYSSRIGQQH